MDVADANTNADISDIMVVVADMIRGGAAIVAGCL